MITIIEDIKQSVTRCDECDIKIGYDSSDVRIGAYGCGYITCPKCGELVFLDDPEHSLILTPDNIQFPLHFYKTGKNAVKNTDEEINTYIKECVRDLEKSEEDYGVFRYTGSGNTMVFTFKYEDEYAIFVARDFYESSIPR